MKELMKKSTMNQRMAAIAMILGVFALFAGDPYRGRIATIDAKELALVVHNEVDHITPANVADWIIAGRADYRLVDMRKAEEYATYHIPGAENISLAELTDDRFLRDEKIVLYSDRGIHAAQGWFLMRSQDFRGAYILLGGLEAWKNEVLFPSLPATATDAEQIDFAKKREVSAYFGGSPRTGGANASGQAFVAPNIEMPVPVVPPASGAKKKKKEGC